MGFYDCRCRITGVSLKGADATAVLLQKFARAFRPITLPVTGNYNRYGTIDGIAEDANTRLILKFFLDKLQSGEFVIDEPYWLKDYYPITDLEHLLWGFERNTNDNHETAVLNGKPVVVALVCRAVWDSLASSGSSRKSDEALFAEVFDGAPVAEEIYRGQFAKVSEHLRELAAVNDFLTSRGIAWKPTEGDGQHYDEEMRKYLATARKKFRDSPAVLEGLNDYEREVADLLTDEDEE